MSSFNNESVSVVMNNEVYSSGLSSVSSLLKDNGFYFIKSDLFKSVIESGYSGGMDDWETFQNSWDDLVQDEFMADNRKYRKRRYATLHHYPSDKTWTKEDEQPHYQGRDYNNLNGGVKRYFSPIKDEVLFGNTMSNIVDFGIELFNSQNSESKWHIEVHQFRIEASEIEKGKPTPEGVHRDGVDFVLMMMVKRHNIKNGQTTIYDLDKNILEKFTLLDPCDVAVLNDHYVFHGVSDIDKLSDKDNAYRDILVVTYRKEF